MAIKSWIQLYWYKATHHVFGGDEWMIVIGPDAWNTAWGVTWNHGVLPPNSFSGDRKRWRVEWRINIHFPFWITRKVST